MYIEILINPFSCMDTRELVETIANLIVADEYSDYDLEATTTDAFCIMRLKNQRVMDTTMHLWDALQEELSDQYGASLLDIQLKYDDGTVV